MRWYPHLHPGHWMASCGLRTLVGGRCCPAAQLIPGRPRSSLSILRRCILFLLPLATDLTRLKSTAMWISLAYEYHLQFYIMLAFTLRVVGSKRVWHHKDSCLFASHSGYRKPAYSNIPVYLEHLLK